ncbi:putative flavin monooxygenase, FAD/NAD(P)-binding domain superfamily [Septoria linicola]|nr:putative flavin monooxygenase, FAD/NAD(P)-binding domain superfamily [Septoria linicola]
MGSIPHERRFKADTVCIIGAGPSGIAAAKYLAAEKTFSRIVVYEQRSKAGGLWNYIPCDSETAKVPIPQTNPHAGHDEPIWETNGGSGTLASDTQEPQFMTPVYERLETNIPAPKALMGFSDLEWQQGCQLFPKHQEVLAYIDRYAQDVSHLISFKTQVLDVRLCNDQKWTVKTRPIDRSMDGKVTEEVFDAVICANGHYDVPYIPSVSGIEAWNEAFPGVISHSKFYRRPEQYAGKKVIVVGNSASGIDIGAQVETVCKVPLIMSQKSESYLNVEGAKSTKVERPEIVEYLVKNRSVRFADGTIEADIDAILYCTGYFYSYPFLDSLDPPVVKTGERVVNTYEHIFYKPQPTLSFLGLNQKVIPFPMAEVQAAVVARVLSGRLPLPLEHEMQAWEDAVVKEMGDGRNFHVLKFPKDADHINMLHDWARSADRESSGVRKTPPRWHEKQYWIRERFPNIKKAFNDRGEERFQVQSLEELGYDFAKWREEKEKGEHTL